MVVQYFLCKKKINKIKQTNKKKVYMNKMLFDEQLPLERKTVQRWND